MRYEPPRASGRFTALVLLALAGPAAGCAVRAHAGGAWQEGTRSLLVQNQSLDAVTVYVSGQRVGWVMPQGRACLPFPWDDAPVHLRVHSVGRTLTLPSIAPDTQTGWRLIVHNPGNAQETELFGVPEGCGEPGRGRAAPGAPSR